MTVLEVPVLIVGGGPAGLTSSILLSNLGVEHLMVERHLTTSPFPKAHLVNPRALEILRQAGVADDVYRQSGPSGEYKVRFQTSLGDDGALDGRELFTIDGFGGGALREYTERTTPCPHTNLPQMRLEPILRDHAERRAPESVRFGHELVDLRQDHEGISAVIRDSESGESYDVRAAYVVAADGGKTLSKQLGVNYEGPTALARLVSNHVTVDLSNCIQGDALITLLRHPDSPFRFVGLVPMGPTYGTGGDWGRKSEEWGVSFALGPEEDHPLDPQSVADFIRAATRLPDLELEVHRTNTWVVERVVADRFQFGRIFLVGDAAHRHVPTNGLGLNSAIEDAHNLAWKLAAVAIGNSGPGLLDTYEQERRPADLRNADWALFTYQNTAQVDIGLGLDGAATPEERRAALQAYLAETPQGATLRARAQEIIGTQRMEYQALDIELGYYYEDGAVVGDGTLPPQSDPLGIRYEPTTRPGHRLPHCWLERDGRRLSTHDLTGRGDRFALITGSTGAAWHAAAEQASAQFGTTIEVASVGNAAGYVDCEDTWSELSGVGDDGAILVRPDNHVAWRVNRLPARPTDELSAALSHVLARRGHEVNGDV